MMILMQLQIFPLPLSLTARRPDDSRSGSMDADRSDVPHLDDAGREQLLHRSLHLPGHRCAHAHRGLPRLLRRLQGVAVPAGLGKNSIGQHKSEWCS